MLRPRRLSYAQDSDDEEETPAASVSTPQSEDIEDYLSAAFTTCVDNQVVIYLLSFHH